MSVERFDHTCGLVGDQVVVVGGYPSLETAEVLDLKTLTWRSGPGMPTERGTLRSSRQVYQLGDTFWVFGGSDGYGSKYDTVFEFDPVTFDWVLRDERLVTARFGHGVVAIPNRLLNFGE